MRKNPLLYIFVIILVLLTVLDFFSYDKKFSDLENRMLSLKPKFTVKGFINGDYTRKYEKYINDQFVFRDKWINVKSKVESALGKTENNSIIYGKDKYLFEKFDILDKERISKNIDAIDRFTKKVNIPVSIMLVPNSYEIYNEKLPKNLELIDQEKVISEIYKILIGSNNIYLLDKFIKNKEKYLYYKTDHHWTTYGAYLAYEEFIKSIGEESVDINKIKAQEIKGFYGSYYSKSKKTNVDEDTILYYDIPNIEMKIDDKIYDSLYDYNKIDERDKYGLFLRGNTSLNIIKNKELKNNKKLLVIKDSYANSLIPFLTYNYEEIHVIDLRSFHVNLSKYLEDNNFDDILILYNLINFSRDVNIIKIKY